MRWSARPPEPSTAPQVLTPLGGGHWSWVHGTRAVRRSWTPAMKFGQVRMSGGGAVEAMVQRFAGDADLDGLAGQLLELGGQQRPAGRSVGTGRAELTDLGEREAHVPQEQDAPDRLDGSAAVVPSSRPALVGLQEAELLVVAQRGCRHARLLGELADRQQVRLGLTH